MRRALADSVSHDASACADDAAHLRFAHNTHVANTRPTSEPFYRGLTRVSRPRAAKPSMTALVDQRLVRARPGAGAMSAPASRKFAHRSSQDSPWLRIR